MPRKPKKSDPLPHAGDVADLDRLLLEMRQVRNTLILEIDAQNWGNVPSLFTLFNRLGEALAGWSADFAAETQMHCVRAGLDVRPFNEVFPLPLIQDDLDAGTTEETIPEAGAARSVEAEGDHADAPAHGS